MRMYIAIFSTLLGLSFISDAVMDISLTIPMYEVTQNDS
jgi:hypothetical protein